MRICICPGSFDPVTMGHIDIISRASRLFDKVIVAVMANPAKTKSAFSVEERINFIQRSTSHMTNVEADYASGLLAEYAKKKNACAIVKGLRAVSDFDYEFQQALMNKQMNGDVVTVFLVTDIENLFLSSSAVKQVCELGGDIRPFVPVEIHDDIVKRLNGKEDI